MSEALDWLPAFQQAGEDLEQPAARMLGGPGDGHVVPGRCP